MNSLVQPLLAHCEWANAVFFRIWAASPVPEHEELRRRVEHLILVQHNFHRLVTGGPPTFPTDAPPKSHAELKAWARASHAEWTHFGQSLDAVAFDRRVALPWFRDPPCEVSVAEAMVQVALHAQHHRGQLMTRLADFGGTPENVDWVIWLWRQRPEAAWD